MSIGFLASAFSPNFYVLIVSFGGIAGFGASLIYLTANIAVGYYFESKRSLAAGITRVGGSLGQFVYAPLATFLIKYYGLQITIGVISGFAFICVFLGILMRPLGMSNENDIRVLEKGLLYRKMWDSKKELQESTKVIRTLSRSDIFHQGCVNNLLRANKVLTGWDDNRHLLFPTSRYVLLHI